jgi:hypothetical protein
MMQAESNSGTPEERVLAGAGWMALKKRVIWITLMLTREGGLLQMAASVQTNSVGVRRQIVSEP